MESVKQITIVLNQSEQGELLALIRKEKRNAWRNNNMEKMTMLDNLAKVVLPCNPEECEI